MASIKADLGFREANDYIPSLDGIRASAAMLVFVSHAGFGHIVPGGFGVTIFFFLSGYLITTLLRKELERTNSIDFGKFYLRRMYRIFPPLYLVLLVGIVVAYIGEESYKINLPATLSQVLFWANYYAIYFGGGNFVAGTAVYWSLAVEEHFYLCFPLVFWLLLRRRSYESAAKYLLVFCLCALLWRICLVIMVGASSTYTYMATDTRFDSLLFGCVMGIWMNPVLDRDWSIGTNARVLVLVISLTALLSTFLYRNEVFRETLRYSIQGMALFPLFWLSIRHPNWIIFKWLNWNSVRFFGIISFSFYLSHLIIIEAIARWASRRFEILIFGFICTFVFSALIYYIVERPISRIRRRLHSI